MSASESPSSRPHFGPTHLVCAAPSRLDPDPTHSRTSGIIACDAVWATYSRRRGLTWSPEQPPQKFDPHQFWTWVLSLAKGGRRILIVTPDGTEFLTLTGFWGMESRGYFSLRGLQSPVKSSPRSSTKTAKPWIGKHVLSGTPTILVARTAGGSVKVVSHGNYLDTNPGHLAEAVGVPLRAPGLKPVGGGFWEPDPDEVATILTRWMRWMIVEWLSKGFGPWADTAGSLSRNLWRKADGKGAIRSHRDDECRRVELAGQHGGRASVWFYGVVGNRNAIPAGRPLPPDDKGLPVIPGRCHKLDVRSMYPHLLGERRFPVRLLGMREKVKPATAAAYAKAEGVIAVCWLDAKHPEYPIKAAGRSRYPVGRFCTVLTGPEVMAAHADGSLLAVPVLYRYEMGRPFSRWSRIVLAEREAARRCQDRPREFLWKIVANSLSGKLAQKSHRWEVVPGERAPQRWGVRIRRGLASDTTEVRLYIAGIPHRRVEAAPHIRLPMAARAYLLGYGRAYMRDIRGRLPKGSVVAQDTDGLWVTDAGLRKARRIGLLGDDKPGSLRLVKSVGYFRAWGAKHYYNDGEWVVAGYRHGWQLTGPTTADVTTTTDPARQGLDPEANPVRRHTERRALGGVVLRERTDAQGWVIPQTLKASCEPGS